MKSTDFIKVMYNKDCKFVCKNCGHIFEERISMCEKMVTVTCPLCGQVEVIYLWRNK